MVKRIAVVCLVIIAILAGISACTAGSSNNAENEINTSDVKAPKTLEAKTSNETKSQKNAIRQAKNYLEFGISKEALFYQLSSSAGDGFSEADATYAVNHVDANWNEQAYRSGKLLLDVEGYSRAGMIKQLSSSYGNKFTEKQAIYAANKLGL